jgi:hypothetical protein
MCYKKRSRTPWRWHRQTSKRLGVIVKMWKYVNKKGRDGNSGPTLHTADRTITEAMLSWRWRQQGLMNCWYSQRKYLASQFGRPVPEYTQHITVRTTKSYIPYIRSNTCQQKCIWLTNWKMRVKFVHAVLTVQFSNFLCKEKSRLLQFHVKFVEVWSESFEFCYLPRIDSQTHPLHIILKISAFFT